MRVVKLTLPAAMSAVATVALFCPPLIVTLPLLKNRVKLGPRSVGTTWPLVKFAACRKIS